MTRWTAVLCLAAFAARAEAPPDPPPAFALRVHLLTPDARVQLRLGEQVVCTAPCDRTLELRGDETFTLGGPGLADSREFGFAPRDGEVTLDVHPASGSGRTLSRAAIALGAMVFLAGGITGSIAERDCAQSYYSETCSTRPAINENITGALILGGAALILVGLVAYLQQPATDFQRVP